MKPFDRINREATHGLALPLFIGALLGVGCNYPVIAAPGGTTGLTGTPWSGTLTFSNASDAGSPTLASFSPSSGTVTDPDGRLGMVPLANGQGGCTQTMTIGIPGAVANTDYPVGSAVADGGGGAAVTYQETCAQGSPGEWYGVAGSITVNAVTSSSASLTFNAVQMEGTGDAGAFQISGQITGDGSL